MKFPVRTSMFCHHKVKVSQDLERDPLEAVDIRVPMSPYMIGIQKAVIEVMDACLNEMRKMNKVGVEDLTVENGLFKSFDEIVRRKLDPIWHTSWKKTKQLISDLKTLRKLLDYLARSDGGKSVVPNKTASTRKRKLEMNKSEYDSSASANSGLALKEVFEEPPKWKVLRVRE